MHSLLNESEIAVALGHTVSPSKTVFLAVKTRNGPAVATRNFEVRKQPETETLDFPESVRNWENWNF